LRAIYLLLPVMSKLDSQFKVIQMRSFQFNYKIENFAAIWKQKSRLRHR